MLSGEATNTNFIVFGLTRPGLELTIYRTRDEHANHHATDAIEKNQLNLWCIIFVGVILQIVSENAYFFGSNEEIWDLQV